MKNLLKNLLVLPWRALGWLRGVIANLLMLAVLVIFLFGMFGQGNTTLPSNAILTLQPGTTIVEQRSYDDPLSILSTDKNKPGESVLHELASAVR